MLNEYHKAVLAKLNNNYTSTKTISNRVEDLNDHGVAKALSDLEKRGLVLRKTFFSYVNGIKRLDKAHSRWRKA